MIYLMFRKDLQLNIDMEVDGILVNLTVLLTDLDQTRADADR